MTEQQLYDMISESIHRVLSEAKATADEVYQKYYSDVDRDLFDAALKSDPTTKDGYTGKYAKWLLNLARHGKWKAGDAPETKAALERFMRTYKNLEKKDIQQYGSVGELYDAVMQTEPQKTRREAKADAEKVYEDSDWTVVVPKTEDAAKVYGKGTRWCTAADKNNMFGYYNEEGPLYILISKKDGSKFQIHFPTDQYMDAADEPFGDMNNLTEHGNVNGLTNFLKTQTDSINFRLFPTDRTLEGLSNYLYDTDEDYYDIDIEELMHYFTPKYSVTDIYNVLLEAIPYYVLFNECFKINEDFEVIDTNNYGYNILWHTMNDTEELVSQEWFYKIYKPNDNTHIMAVRTAYGYNYITPKGQLLLKDDVPEAQSFSDGIGIFYTDSADELSFLFADGHIVNTGLKKCLAEPFQYSHPYTLVSRYDGDYSNLIGKDGKVLFDRWLQTSVAQGNPHGWYVFDVQGNEYFMDARNGKMYDAEQAENQNSQA